jgi:hypothetical protein
VRCAVVSIVARGLTSGQKRPRGPRRATDVGIAASLRRDGSVGVDRFGFRVTRQTAALTFVEMQLRFVRLRHSALHLSFLLVRLGGFAADYFRGHPSALRAERGASGSIDHQCDPREASRDDPGGISRNLTYCFFVLPISTMECLNGSDAMRLRYATDRAEVVCAPNGQTPINRCSAKLDFGGINPAKACLWRKRTRMLRPMPEWPSDRLHRFIDFPEKSFIP